ncbi:Leucine-rich repeat - like 10, partial [Theobroma cacao]
MPDEVGSDLKGSVPSSLFNLSSLQFISLGFNKFACHLSSDMFDYLPNLQYLDLHRNQLEGTVPLEIGNLTSLHYLDIGGNKFVEQFFQIIFKRLTSVPNFLQGRLPTLPPSLHGFCGAENHFVGEIPSSFCNLSSLGGLNLFANNLGGIIPECIGNLSSSLSILNLQKNNFRGKIPQNFAKGCLLRNFHINNNQLDGSLPRSLGNCHDLRLLDVGNNFLNDTFPNWLGNLTQLQVLILRSNRFYGHINNFKVNSSFNRLHIIDLSHNNFIGYLPTKFFENLHAMREEHEKKPEYMYDASADGWFGFAERVFFTTKGLELEFQILTSLMAVDFSNNQFIGEIPEILGELHSLIFLNLSHNSLMGHIPSILSNLSQLESLDLSSNKLKGIIPTQLQNLLFLAVLNLSHNYLVGPIPQDNQFHTFTNDSYNGNLGLCGFPLSKSCSNDEGLRPPPTQMYEEDRFTRAFNWKLAMLMGYGCGLVFGLSMGYIVLKTGKPWWIIRMIDRGQQEYVRGKARRSGRRNHTNAL